MSNASVAKEPFADQDPNHGMLFFLLLKLNINLQNTFQKHVETKRIITTF